MSGSQTQAGCSVGRIGVGREDSRGSSSGGGSSNGDGGSHINNSTAVGSQGGSVIDSLPHAPPNQQSQLQQQHSSPQIVMIENTSTTNISVSSLSATATNMAADSSPRESGDDSEDESEILEESPCGRWLKRREEVDQRDVPGIDCVHLAMDTEEGVEVVWNEVRYTNLQELKSQEEKMSLVFDNLLQLDHHNIVKFHRYWTDTLDSERPRLIFITEFMSSGSLKQFLKRTKRNAKRLPLEAWRRWCTQILSALTYLHSCTPPILHGNLTCDSIFIQHNGLVKIGTVVPDAVHYSLRQKQQKAVEQGAYFMAPEYSAGEPLTAAVDIYAFGMCALEMAALEIQNSSGDTAVNINEEIILKTINSLEHDLQRDLIFKCLRRNPSERPTASDLLFHPLLFEVHSLKLLAAHCLIFAPKNQTMFSETVIDAMMQRFNRPDVVMAHVSLTDPKDANMEGDRIPSDVQHQQQIAEDGSQQTTTPGVTHSKNSIREYRLSDVPSADKLEKFVEDVKFGVYPLTAFSGKKPPPFRSRASSPERADSVKSASPEPVDIESRRIVNMMCSVKKLKQSGSDILMTILLRMDDKMNRQLSCAVTEADNASDLTQELVRLGFVHIEDQDNIQALLEETLRSTFSEGGAAYGEFGAQERTFSASINEQNNGIVGSNNDNNNTTVDMTQTTVTDMQNQQQPEHSWSVADSKIQNDIMTPAPILSPVSATAAAAVALGLTDTVTVTSDSLASADVNVSHERPQQIQQRCDNPSHQPLQLNSIQQQQQQQQQQQEVIVQPNVMLPTNVADNQYSSQINAGAFSTTVTTKTSMPTDQVTTHHSNRNTTTTTPHKNSTSMN